MAVWMLFLGVSFFASAAGSICGIGGGVIIKPVLDATRVLSVSAVSFLSGCTVLAMSVISVGKRFRKKEQGVERRTSFCLAAGAALGGAVGQYLFQYVYVICSDKDKVGAVQAGILLLVTAGTLYYTIRKSHIRSHHVKNLIMTVFIGVILGMMSAFLGIGGGPINLVVLHFFFSMAAKEAAGCSLFIIMFSQLTSLVRVVLKGNLPDIEIFLLLLMVCGGLAGGFVGSRIHQKISAEGVNRLFIGLMLVIMGICVYNIVNLTRF